MRPVWSWTVVLPLLLLPAFLSGCGGGYKQSARLESFVSGNASGKAFFLVSERERSGRRDAEDAEYKAQVAGQLAKAGFQQVSGMEKADVVVVMTYGTRDHGTITHTNVQPRQNFDGQVVGYNTYTSTSRDIDLFLVLDGFRASSFRSGPGEPLWRVESVMTEGAYSLRTGMPILAQGAACVAGAPGSYLYEIYSDGNNRLKPKR